MGISLESALSKVPAPPVEVRGDEWIAAHAKVVGYCEALRIHDRRLLDEVAVRVLDNAMRRFKREPDGNAVTIAAEELHRTLSEWYAAVLGSSDDMPDPFLSVRGRLALLIADVPGKWQDQFLKPPPWPEEFVRAMRDAYLRSGPDFQLSQMNPRPMDFGAITALTNLGNLPYFRIILIWLAFAALLVVLFQITH
jgi:hypothetical protein